MIAKWMQAEYFPQKEKIYLCGNRSIKRKFAAPKEVECIKYLLPRPAMHHVYKVILMEKEGEARKKE